MRQFSSVGAIANSVAFLFVIGFMAYGARYALGDTEPRSNDVDVVSNDPDFVYASHYAELEATELPFRPEIAAEDGAEIYMTRCMSCHQMNGRGVSGVFPPLAGAGWVTGDKGRLIRIVLNGLTGEIDVEGETYSGAMPPWQSFLDDKQMAALLTYIRSSWGNEASEVTAAEVSKVRAATKERRDPWTQDELMKDENSGIPGETAKGAGETKKEQTPKSDTSKDGKK